MKPDDTDGNSVTNDIAKQQKTLLNQIFQATSTMHHIDELLQWLAYAIARRFDIQLVQCWTNQINQAGRLSVHLRVIIRQDITIPEPLVVNEVMASLAQRIVSERHSYQPQLVETVFPSYQAILLKRYGLYYCGACFNSRNSLIAEPEIILANEKPAIPLTMATLILMRHHPQPALASTISALLDQTIAIAERRGLLQPAKTNPYDPTTTTQFTSATPHTPVPPPPPPETTPTLERLIPHRILNADLLLTDNPFVSKKDVIADKKALHLFSAINGHTNIAQLREKTGLNTKEIYAALQYLINLHRIELYQPNGQLVTIPSWHDDI